MNDQEDKLVCLFCLPFLFLTYKGGQDGKSANGDQVIAQCHVSVI